MNMTGRDVLQIKILQILEGPRYLISNEVYSLCLRAKRESIASLSMEERRVIEKWYHEEHEK